MQYHYLARDLAEAWGMFRAVCRVPVSSVRVSHVCHRLGDGWLFMVAV